MGGDRDWEGESVGEIGYGRGLEGRGIGKKKGVKGDMDDESGGKGKGRWLDGGMGDK